MTCKICGRNSCTESFHSLEAQQEYEDEHKEAIESLYPPYSPSEEEEE